MILDRRTDNNYASAKVASSFISSKIQSYGKGYTLVLG